MKTLRKLIKQIVIFLTTAFFMMAGFIVGLTISQILQADEYSIYSILVAVSFSAFSVVLAIYIHDSGHYIMGKFMGYKLISWKFADILMIPLKKKLPLNKQLIYICGGIISDFIMGILFILVFIMSNMLSWNLDNIYRLLLLFCATACILHSCVNLTSYFSSIKPTDGKLIWSILFKTAFSKYYLNNVNISLAMENGYTPKEIPMDEISEGDNLSSFDIIFILNLYYKALDSNDIRNVLKYIRLLEANYDKIPYSLYITSNYELCFINCIIGDYDKSTMYYGNIKDFIENNFDMTSLRARSYYEYFIKENKRTAIFYAKAALSFQEEYKLKGLVSVETALLNDILAKSDS